MFKKLKKNRIRRYMVAFPMTSGGVRSSCSAAFAPTPARMSRGREIQAQRMNEVPMERRTFAISFAPKRCPVTTVKPLVMPLKNPNTQ